MRPGVLVTRPLPQAEATAERLTALGYAPCLAPMLRIEAITPPPTIDLDDVQAILITSVNGAATLAKATRERAIPVLAVGDRTAEAARQAGFADVRSAEGDAGSLTLLACETLTPENGAILHARGRDVARSPLPALADLGFSVREAVLYEAVQISSLPKDAGARLGAGEIAAVLVYSARSGAALAHAVRGMPLDRTVLIGISKAAIEPLAGFAFADHIVAEQPVEQALFAALRTAVPTGL